MTTEAEITEDAMACLVCLYFIICQCWVEYSIIKEYLDLFGRTQVQLLDEEMDAIQDLYN